MKLDTICCHNFIYIFLRFPLQVDGLPYSIGVNKFFGSKTSISNNATSDSYFCSELVASAYKLLGYLPEDVPSNNYLPAMFAQTYSLQLLQGATLSPEIKLVFSKPGVHSAQAVFHMPDSLNYPTDYFVSRPQKLDEKHHETNSENSTSSLSHQNSIPSHTQSTPGSVPSINTISALSSSDGLSSLEYPSSPPGLHAYNYITLDAHVEITLFVSSLISFLIFYILWSSNLLWW